MHNVTTKIECKNLTGKDCDYGLEAITAAEAKEKMRGHMQVVHTDMSEDDKSATESKINDQFNT